MTATAPASAPAYNTRSPAVKRILREAKELHNDPSAEFVATYLDDDIFEWHFTLRGPPGTDFEGGLYHGRIILPPDYPMKPPSIMLLTPNGRFEVGSKICLSITGYHPEFWQPAWGSEGAIGALDYTPEERRMYAKRSPQFVCDKCKDNEHMSPTRLLKAIADNAPIKEAPVGGLSFAYDKPKPAVEASALQAPAPTSPATPPSSPSPQPSASGFAPSAPVTVTSPPLQPQAEQLVIRTHSATAFVDSLIAIVLVIFLALLARRLWPAVDLPEL